MNIRKTAKSLAVAAVVGMCLPLFAATTNEWWNQDFDSIADITALTNETYSTIGQWTRGELDESSIADNAIKLDTQGSDLKWTPNSASTSSIVLVDTDIYLVGSDTPPASTSFDGDVENPVQAAVFLRNYVDYENTNLTTNSALFAYVSAPGGSGNDWVQLAGITMTDTNWYNIKILVTYSGQTPMAQFIVEDVVMEDAVNGRTSFEIANFNSFVTTASRKVNSVSFRGTGNIDNFVANQITPATAAIINFTYLSYTEAGLDTTKSLYLTGSTPDSLSAGTVNEVVLLPFTSDNPSTNLTLARVIKESGTITNDYAASYNSANSTWTLDAGLTLVLTGNIKLSIDTTGLTGPCVVETYYGVAPGSGGGGTPVDPTSPTIGSAASATPLAFEMIGANEYFVVSFAAPESGVVYTLQTTTDLGVAFVDSADVLATATSTSSNQAITLKAPTGGAPTMFFRVKAVAAP